MAGPLWQNWTELEACGYAKRTSVGASVSALLPQEITTPDSRNTRSPAQALFAPCIQEGISIQWSGLTLQHSSLGPGKLHSFSGSPQAFSS